MYYLYYSTVTIFSIYYMAYIWKPWGCKVPVVTGIVIYLSAQVLCGVGGDGAMLVDEELRPLQLEPTRRPPPTQLQYKGAGRELLCVSLQHLSHGVAYCPVFVQSFAFLLLIIGGALDATFGSPQPFPILCLT